MPSMRLLRTAALVCAASVPFLVVSGCGSLVPPDASGMLKIATGQMSNLTGQEIQALTASPIVAAYAPGLQLTDNQADTIAEFLADNSIATIADLQALLLKVQTDPTSVVLPDGFFELFADLQLPANQQVQ